MNIKRSIAVVCASVGALALVPGVASAHPVGEPGTPNCFGQRVSHGASSHERTPVVRADRLQYTVYESGFVSEEEAAAFEETFRVVDQKVTVRVTQAFTRANCSDDPFVP